MSTAEKLTYLNDTKQLLKENINNLGGNLTNEPFRQYASVLEGIYESLPKVSGIGASLSLSPSMVGKIKLNEIQGNALQDGTPTPSSPVPIESVTGLQNVEVCDKNLFDKNNIIEGKYIDGSGNVQTDANSFIGDYIHIDNTKPYYISSSLVNAKRIVYYNASKTFISREVLTTSGSSLTIPNNAYYVIISGYISDLDTLQLEQNITKTDYEPYKGNTYEVNLGNIELNKIGDYKDSIKKSTGKNLFDKSTITENYRIGSDGLPYGDNSCSLSDFIKVEPNTTYYINQTMSYQNTTALYDINKNYISPRIQSGNTFTTTSSTYYVRVSNLKANINTLMLNEGTALPYEPYGKVWYITKNIGKVVLDGTDVKFTYQEQSSLPNALMIPASSRPRGLSSTSSVICSHFSNITAGSGSTLDTLYWGASTQMWLCKNGFTSLQEGNDWLKSNNVEVLYILETPTTTEITNTELINQLESLNNAKSKNGTTNINVTSEDLSMILNVGVLKGE